MEVQNEINETNESASQYQALLTEKQLALENGDYIKADAIMKKITNIKTTEDKRKKKSLIKSFQKSINDIESSFSQEIIAFNQEWDNKENKLTELLESKERTLEMKHKKEINDLYKKFNENPSFNNYKPSSKYLSLKKTEEELVKQDRFLEANRVKNQISNLVKEEIENQKNILNQKINKTVEKLVEKQNAEKISFQKEAAFQFEALSKQKEKEFARVLKKFDNNKNDLEKQIKLANEKNEKYSLTRSSKFLFNL